MVLSLALGFTDNKATVYALVLALSLISVLRFRWRTLLLSALVVAAIFGGRAVFPDAMSFARSYEPSGSAQGRLLIWQYAVEIIRATPGQPFVGAGPDAMELAQYREWVPPEMFVPFYVQSEVAWTAFVSADEGPEVVGVETKYQEGQPLRGKVFLLTIELDDGRILQINQTPIIDKAHNMVLDWVVSYGFFDALLWLVLFLVPVFRWFRSDHPVPFGIAWALAALMIYFLAWFPVISTDPYHILLVAAGWALMAGDLPSLDRPSETGAVRTPTAPG